MGTELLYYIMDYSGNYYRVNRADQLVVAGSQTEATVFTFVQANSRICVGKKASFYCMVPIEESDTIENFSEWVQGCEMDNEKDEIVNADRIEGTGRTTVRNLTYDELQEPVQKSVSSYDLYEIDWAEYLTHFTYVVAALKPYREELSKKESDIDQKICDILHYIELCETNEEEAGDLVELLRVCRENRRDIKDEMARVEYFQTNFGTNANVTKATHALKSIKGLDTRKYKPRKYEELFENCIMKEKRREKADLEVEVPGSKLEKRCYHAQYTGRKESGEDKMTQERYNTPYDGRDNDWLSFARQQAEFYRHAGRYISNLQMTIREIDQEIEGILQETEEANCNVAQGYKVFKRLKELRLERKSKTQELNCLYALTKFIDCDALADTCERNLAEMKDIMNVAGTDIMTQNVIEMKCDGNTESEEVCEVETIQDMVG